MLFNFFFDDLSLTVFKVSETPFGPQNHQYPDRHIQDNRNRTEVPDEGITYQINLTILFDPKVLTIQD